MVRERGDRLDALRAVAAAATDAGLAVRGFASSGLPGPKGNRETFIWCERGAGGGEPLDIERALAQVEA